MTRMDPIDPIAALKATAARPFTQAKAMPPAVYTSEAVVAAELERIFARDWVCVGRASALKKPGDYLTYELAGQPVMVLRDREGQVRAMSNVCLHRMSTLLTGSGRRKVIVCPYHAWTYELDGRLREASYMGKNECFRREELRLPQIRCEIWLGWIFITLNPDAEPVAARLAGLAAEIAPFGMEGYVESFRETHVWDTNWKVLAENFMESYHLPACHAATIGSLSSIDAADMPEGAPAYNIHFISKDPSFTLSVAHKDNRTLEGEWRLQDGGLRGLSLADDHPDPGLFLVPLAAPQGARAGAHHLRRRALARLRRGPRGAGAFRGAEAAARRGERGGPRLHRAGVPRRLLAPRGAGADEPPRAAALRLQPLPGGPAGLTPQVESRLPRAGGRRVSRARVLPLRARRRGGVGVGFGEEEGKAAWEALDEAAASSRRLHHCGVASSGRRQGQAARKRAVAGATLDPGPTRGRRKKKREGAGRG